MQKQVGERNESALQGATSERSASRSKVEFSEDQGVVSVLPSDQAEENGDQESDTSSLSQTRMTLSFLKLVGEISERNISSPGTSDYEQSNANEGDLGSSVVSSKPTDS